MMPLRKFTIHQPKTAAEAAQMLAQFGEVAAFEPDPEARRLAERHGPFEILAGQLPDDVPYESASFDVVAADNFGLFIEGIPSWSLLPHV